MHRGRHPVLPPPVFSQHAHGATAHAVCRLLAGLSASGKAPLRVVPEQIGLLPSVYRGILAPRCDSNADHVHGVRRCTAHDMCACRAQVVARRWSHALLGRRHGALTLIRCVPRQGLPRETNANLGESLPQSPLGSAQLYRIPLTIALRSTRDCTALRDQRAPSPPSRPSSQASTRSLQLRSQRSDAPRARLRTS